MRRRRKSYRWLPPDPGNRYAGPDNQAVIDSPDDGAVGSFGIDIPVSLGNGVVVGATIPLVGDLHEEIIAGVAPPSIGGVPGTMADMTFGYSLVRVVGKLFCVVEQFTFPGVEPPVGLSYEFIVTAGIIVRRVDDNGVPTTSNALPQSYENQSDPYLWRRSWMLCNQPLAQRDGSYYPWPSNNGAYGSIQDGPHVDAKTRRTVKDEERLFLDVEVMTTFGTRLEIEEQISTVRFIWDLRFLGRVFQSAGNKRNASR